MSEKDIKQESGQDRRVAFFNTLATHWDDDEQNPIETVKRLETLAEYLKLASGQSVLEVGCGTGQITGWLADKVAPGSVTAIDFSSEMLARAKSKNINANFMQMDICSPVPSLGLFDLVLCFHSFPHFCDKPLAMATMSKLLKPSGKLIVMHLVGSHKVNHFHDHIGGAVAGDHLPDEQTWNSLLSTAQLKRELWIDRDDLFILSATKI
jgi:demethylmenaquinone methyltransferase/2-methoxy-6-polyprenyl-1,4-benzoquinol methylase